MAVRICGTRSCALPSRGPGPRIIHAEIYPSLVPCPSLCGRVKDGVQVEAAVHWLASHASANTLEDLFAAPGCQPDLDVKRVVQEEGWILGVRPR